MLLQLACQCVCVCVGEMKQQSRWNAVCVCVWERMRVCVCVGVCVGLVEGGVGGVAEWDVARYTEPPPGLVALEALWKLTSLRYMQIKRCIDLWDS